MIKVGDIVTPKKGCPAYEEGARWTGEVVEIDLWEDIGPLTVENHGNIDIKLLTVENYSLDVGEEECYCFYGWEEHLDIIEG